MLTYFNNILNFEKIFLILKRIIYKFWENIKRSNKVVKDLILFYRSYIIIIDI